jgi:EmrB/QacA subfamily drug resistance transporter
VSGSRTDRAALPEPTEAGRGRWLGLLMLSLGLSMIVVDATIVNVAVPSIVRDLKLDGSAAEWIVSIYPLVFAALLISFGRFGDVAGRRRLFLLGLGIFTVGSALAGLAPSGLTLIGARVLQGVGGAAIAPATQSILNTTFRGRDRAIAFGIYGSVIGGMAALGPLLGGWLTTNLSWRWAFYINMPIALVVMVGSLLWIRESRDEDARSGFDPAGFVLITLGLGAIVFALIEGYRYGWLAPSRPLELLGVTWPLSGISIIPLAVLAGLACLVAFAVVELRRKRAGGFYLFDFDLWREPTFRFGNLTATIVSLGEFGLLFALPLFLQAVSGYTAFETGLVFLTLAAGSFVAAPLAGMLAGRFEPRRTVQVGMLLEVVGILGVTLLLSNTVSGLTLAVPFFLYGMGVGFSTAQLANVILSDIPPERSGLASATNSTMRQVGTALGSAILGTVLLVGLNTGTHDRLAQVPGLPPAQAQAIAISIEESAGQALVGLRSEPAAQVAIGPIEDAFVAAARTVGFVAAGFMGLGLAFSLLLPASSASVPRTVAETAEAVKREAAA